MNDKEIVNQLNKLREVQPDSAWQAKNRALLLSQIGPGSKDELTTVAGFSILNLPLRLIKTIPQPVLAVFLIVLFMFGSGVFSIQASKNAKPGDSLYIAKIINERTQQVLTFDEQKKAQLGIEFAGNRAAELNQILSDKSNVNDADKKTKVENLVNDFKKEIDGVKNHIAKISSQTTEQPAPDSNPEQTESSASADEDNAAVFSANLGKDDQGIEVSEPATDEAKATSGDEKLIAAEETTVATSAPESSSATTSDETPAPAESPSDTQKILEQAGILLKNEDYDATISKLNEAGEAMDLAGAGEVKGEVESATTTGEVLGAEESEEAVSTSTEK